MNVDRGRLGKIHALICLSPPREVVLRLLWIDVFKEAK
jgi:hypothetical protein